MLCRRRPDPSAARPVATWAGCMENQGGFDLLDATFRPESPSGADAIATLLHAAFRGDDEVKLVKGLRAAGDLACVLAAEDAGTLAGIIGFVPLGVSPDPGYPVWALAPLAVAPGLQGRAWPGPRPRGRLRQRPGRSGLPRPLRLSRRPGRGSRRALGGAALHGPLPRRRPAAAGRGQVSQGLRCLPMTTSALRSRARSNCAQLESIERR